MESESTGLAAGTRGPKSRRRVGCACGSQPWGKEKAGTGGLSWQAPPVWALRVLISTQSG